MRPAAPGSRIGSGRLRVDAARAIAKLREYQLAERTTWIAEAIRAAVASGATDIALDGDSNDVWLSWSGRPWPVETLPVLLDELVSPEPSRDAQHLRLLATAINSALGLEPAYIDLYSIDEDGSAIRVRYTPEVLELPDDSDDEPAIRQLVCEPIERPRLAPAAGMHLHLRRRAGLETLGHLLRGAVAPELAVAEALCRDVAVPTRIGRHTHGRDYFAGDLLRADLGGSLVGYLALLEPQCATHDQPVAEIAERGVVITRYGLDLGIGGGRAPMPLRLFVDAPRMPTNASRSDVRREAHPVKQAEQRARELTTPLVEQIASELADPETDDERREKLRDAVLAVLAAAAVGVDWPQYLRLLSAPLSRLAALPLVKNAVGKPMPVASRWSSSLVWEGREALDPELEPWIGEVLWVPPGDPAGRLIERAAVNQAQLKRRIKHGKRQLKQRKKFYRHEIQTPQVRPSRGDWIHAEIGAPLATSVVPDSMFADVTGEIAVSPGNGPAEIVLMVEGRPLETVELVSPISFTAIVAHPALRADRGYRKVQRDANYTHAINAAVSAAVRSIEAVAMAERGELPPGGYRLGKRRPDDAERVARLMRAGLELAHKIAESPIGGPMVEVGAWPTTDGRWRSTSFLRELEVVGTAPFSARVDVAKRLVVRTSPADRSLLAELIDGGLVHYDPRKLRSGGDLARELAAEMASGYIAALAIREGDRRGAIAWGGRNSKIEALHAGVPIREYRLEHELTHCQIAVDDDSIVPDDHWSNVTNADILGGVASAWERAMARAVAAALAGDEDRDLFSFRKLSTKHGAGRALCEALVASPVEIDELLGAGLASKLRAAPFVEVLGFEEISPDELASRFEGDIPWVAPPVDVVFGFTPMLVTSAVEADGIARLIGRAAYDAGDDLAELARAAERERKIVKHRRKPPWPEPDLDGKLMFEAEGMKGVLELSLTEDLHVDVLIERRLFSALTEFGPPVRAVVDVPQHWADAEFAELAGFRGEQILRSIRDRSVDLLFALLEGKPEALAADARVTGLARALVVSAAMRDSARKKLRAIPAFETVQGGRASIDAAELAGLVRTASWGGEWLGPSGEPDPLDDPVLQVNPEIDRTLHELIDALAAEGAIDETRPLARLQVGRAMERGILSKPVIPGAVSELKRDLASLPEHGRLLGTGEIALVRENPRVLVHELGVMVGHIDIDVTPPVQVAVEDPALVSAIGRSIKSSVLAARVGRAARELVERLLGSDVELPVWAARAIGAAALQQVILPRRLGDRRLFATISGELLTWKEVARQAAELGEIWYVTVARGLAPLDPDRFVLLLDDDSIASSNPPFKLVEASSELALDAEARRNRDRPAVEALELPSEAVLNALEIIDLDGDGVTAPRGKIAVLAPDADQHRGLMTYRELKPLGLVDDPCEWPTAAVVDDRGLEPDRTWNGPDTNTLEWHTVRSAVTKASEKALGGLVPAPREVLASRSVWNLEVPKSSAIARGRLWLSKRWSVGTISVECAAGEIVVHPTAADGTELPVSGKLLVYTPGRVDLRAEIDRLARAQYDALVRAAVNLGRDPELASAHAAVGLLTGLVDGTTLGDMTFDCFAPEPLTAFDVVLLEPGGAKLPVVSAPDRGGELSLIDDGSLVSQVLIGLIGGREEVAVPEPISEPAPDPDEPEHEPQPDPEPEIEEQNHPLSGLAAAIGARLSEIGVGGFYLRSVAVMPTMRSLLCYKSGSLYIGGASDELAAIEVARQSSSPWAGAAIDAVVAHAMAALAYELVEVDSGDHAAALERLLG